MAAVRASVMVPEMLPVTPPQALRLNASKSCDVRSTVWCSLLYGRWVPWFPMAGSECRRPVFRRQGQAATARPTEREVTLVGLLRDRGPTEALFRGPAGLCRHAGA